MSELAFWVIGKPAPQGSKRYVGNGRFIESSAALGPWRDSVAVAAAKAALEQGWETLTGPVEVTITFALARPKSAPKSRVRPTVAPDIDKLARGCLDALTYSRVYGDDAQVVRLAASKWYSPDDKPTGARITVTEVQ